jgi:hypothetical protein
LFLEIRDEGGNSFPNVVFDEPMFKESSKVKIPASDFITIQPKDSLVLKRSISLQNYAIKTPGRYSATLYYDNPLPSGVVSPGVNVWNSQPDTIKTDPIHFNVER